MVAFSKCKQCKEPEIRLTDEVEQCASNSPSALSASAAETQSECIFFTSRRNVLLRFSHADYNRDSNLIHTDFAGSGWCVFWLSNDKRKVGKVMYMLLTMVDHATFNLVKEQVCGNNPDMKCVSITCACVRKPSKKIQSWRAEHGLLEFLHGDGVQTFSFESPAKVAQQNNIPRIVLLGPEESTRWAIVDFDEETIDSHYAIASADEASLPSSSTSWSAPRAGVSSSLSDDASVERALRSILNKLTIEKFDTLYEQLATCGISTPEHIEILMREVFEKATEQHHFIGMYADLCVRLKADPRLAATMGAAVGEPTSFSHLLWHQCKVAFEQLLKPRTEKANEGDLTLEAKEERKRRALGNVKFVGQLMVCGMFSSSLLVTWSDALWRGHTTCPEALESLAALLTVAGKKFDGSRLDTIFGRLSELTKDREVSARNRFLLQDLLELREKGWPAQGRPAVAKEGPMRLEKVKERAADQKTSKENKSARRF